VSAEPFLVRTNPAEGVDPVPGEPPPAFTPADRDWQGECWDWHLLPNGLIYRSYLAGLKEPRMGTAISWDDGYGTVWDSALGGRIGLVRYGTADAMLPDGYELDVEGAAFPRLDPEDDLDVVTNDYRVGVPLTHGRGAWRTKLAYYHFCAHLGDEFLLKNPGVQRRNYVRDAIVLGRSYYILPELRLYAEAAWSFKATDGAEPWEFQFGADYAPAFETGWRGAPFAAINGHLREELDFGGNLTVQVGWAWRSGLTGRLMRTGVQYYNGAAEPFEFLGVEENKIGWGLWCDY
jgi:hypothetical protein